MASNAIIKAADDALNLGKSVGLRLKDSAYLHRVVVEHPQDITGTYFSATGLQTIKSGAAHAADDGFFVVLNPIGSAVTVALRRVAYQGAPVDTATAPTTLIEAERFTFTGTPSSTLKVFGKTKSTLAAATAQLRMGATGMSLTMVGAPHRGFLIPAVPSGNSATGSSNELVWTPNDAEGETELAPGEGLLFRQAAAGAGSDTRVFLFNVSLVEFTPET